MTAFETVIDRLTDVTGHQPKVTGRQAISRCPAHDDRSPSLSVTRGEERVLLKCHAGCDIDNILDQLRLSRAELFDEARPNSSASVVTAEYTYLDEQQHVLYVVERRQPKSFRQKRPDGRGGWVWQLTGTRRVLYRLPKLAEAIRTGAPIYIVEGEKDVHAAESAGATATCNAGGAGKWREDYTDSLVGAAEVYVVADRDEPGRAHARQVLESLRAKQIPAVLVEPAEGKDLSDHLAAGKSLDDLAPLAEEDNPLEYVYEQFPRLNWQDLWADETEEEWIVEPILPARRLVAIYSPAKVGKSLLMLEIAAGVATGREVLGVKPDPRRVLYVDFENDPKADVRERLQGMRYQPADLENLCYLSFPALSALDGPQGAVQLLDAVKAYDCEVVVIDTISRAVKGPENENDTWLAFYRHTGLALKQAQIALVRLDHTGKDELKGQRGGSAKTGDIDAMWRMTTIADGKTYRLECEAARMPISEKTLVLHRETLPYLRHRVDPAGRAAAVDAKTAEDVRLLEFLKIDPDLGRPAVSELVKKAGYRIGTNRLQRAIKARKNCPGQLGQLNDHWTVPDSWGQLEEEE